MGGLDSDIAEREELLRAFSEQVADIGYNEALGFMNARFGALWLRHAEHVMQFYDERTSHTKYDNAYCVHLKSISLCPYEYDRLIKIGFRNWIFEMAEQHNIEYDFIQIGDKNVYTQ